MQTLFGFRNLAPHFFGDWWMPLPFARLASVVQYRMFAYRHNLQVLRSVVRLNAILVMNNLTRHQPPIKQLLHHVAMFLHLASVDANVAVSRHAMHPATRRGGVLATGARTAECFGFCQRLRARERLAAYTACQVYANGFATGLGFAFVRAIGALATVWSQSSSEGFIASSASGFKIHSPDSISNTCAKFKSNFKIDVENVTV